MACITTTSNSNKYNIICLARLYSSPGSGWLCELVLQKSPAHRGAADNHNCEWSHSGTRSVQHCQSASKSHACTTSLKRFVHTLIIKFYAKKGIEPICKSSGHCGAHYWP